MSVVYSLYDALVSIHVPDDKAKAVIDAIEREMMDKLATKADIEHLRLATKADIEHLRFATKADLAHVQELVSKDLQIVKSDFEYRLAGMEGRLTVKLGTIAGIWTGILFGLLKLTA